MARRPDEHPSPDRPADKQGAPDPRKRKAVGAAPAGLPAAIRPLWDLLGLSVRAVPVNKLAVGVVGLGAAVAIVLAVTRDWKVAVFGILGMLVCMTLLLILGWAKEHGKTEAAPVIRVFLWVALVAFAAAVFLVLSTFAFHWPAPAADLLWGGRAAKEPDAVPAIKRGIADAFAGPLDASLPAPDASPDANFRRLRQALFRSAPLWAGRRDALRAALNQLDREGFSTRSGYPDFGDDLERLMAETNEVVDVRSRWLTRDVLPALRARTGAVEVPLPREAWVNLNPVPGTEPRQRFDRVDPVEKELSALRGGER